MKRIATAVLAICAAVLTAQAQELEGVPGEIVGRIIDVTTLRAQRSPFEASGLPTPILYRVTMPVERAWRFPYTRPQQRRFFVQERAPMKRSAIAEIAAQAPGRARYNLFLSGGGENARASARLIGEAQNGTFTQGRGGSNHADATAGAAWNSDKSALRLNARWSTRSSNWIQTLEETIPKEKTLLSAEIALDRKPPASGGTRQQWTVQGGRYSLPHEKSTGAVAEGRAQGVVELQSMGKNPRRLQFSGAVRSAEDPLTAGTHHSAIGLVSFEDRHAATAVGTFSWSVGATAFRQPDRTTDTGESSRVLPAFKAAWTTGLDEGWGTRFEAQNRARLTPIEQYVETDHTIVNGYLKPEVELSGGGSIWVRYSGVEAKAGAKWRSMENLSVWDETRIDEAPAWQPVNVKAQLVEARASLRIDMNPRFRLQSELTWERVQSVENLNLDVLPYRPQLRAQAEAYAALNETVQLKAGVEWIGERHNIKGVLSESPDDPEALEPYARLRAQASFALSEAVSIRLNAETSLGEYRELSSKDALYEMTQHSAGIGFAGRF